MHSVLSAEIETESNAGFSPSLFSTEGGHSATHFMTIPAVEGETLPVEFFFALWRNGVEYMGTCCPIATLSLPANVQTHAVGIRS